MPRRALLPVRDVRQDAAPAARAQHGVVAANAACFLHCLALAVFAPAACCMQARQRRAVRAKVNLAGGGGGGCVRAACCTGCGLMQAENEARVQGGEDALMGCQKPAGMAYSYVQVQG